MKARKMQYIPKPEDLTKRRYLSEVLKDPALALAVKYPELGKEVSSFFLSSKTNIGMVEVGLGYSKELYVLQSQNFTPETEHDSLNEVRLFDSEQGCVVPWPAKPYPDFQKYKAALEEFQKLERLKRLVDVEAGLRADLEALLAEKASLSGVKK